MTLTNETALTTTIPHNRRYGIEIECFGITIAQALVAIRATGIEVNEEHYNHQARPVWKIVLDGSVNDGFEVVSPILSGNEGLEQVRKVAKSLVAAGAKVDRRCGFHVHVDARDLSGADVTNCIRRYAANEAQIDSFMPSSRRGSANNYCRPMHDVVEALRNVTATSTARHVAERVYERYYKLNVAAFLRHGTVEFRQHGGTVDYRKMINWIIFCVQFIEDSRTVLITEVPAATASVSSAAALRKNAIEHKFRKLAEALDQHDGRYNPVSAADLAMALEVEESTIPSYVSQFRTRYPQAVIQARRGRGYYRDCTTTLVSLVGNSSSAQAPNTRVEVPVERGIFANLSPDVASHFHERTMDLAAS